MKSDVRAIVVAAGRGSRMQEYTADKPKCLLEVGGETLLQRQFDAFAMNGVKDLHVIRGYKKECINYPGVFYYDNDDYESNNVLLSLFYAEAALQGHVIISYSDIIFKSDIVDRLLRSTGEIAIVVDREWRAAYAGRKDHPLEEAEKVVWDERKRVIEIGKHLKEECDCGEFIGMMKLSPLGSVRLRQQFNLARVRYWNTQFHHASVFQKAYLTDMLQEMTDIGCPARCVLIEGGWRELDTAEDYRRASREFDAGAFKAEVDIS